ncbi:MAG: sugar transporter [Prevotella sp.]|nr:sugar transporter [Prevotella sp.]MBO5156226.1 sugar transporter [Prevotella sp.]MBO5204599.1 sugar transporter [Prevotella sp.]
MSESRVHKSLLNAKVNLVFYFLSLFFAFFSRKIFLDCLGAEFIGLTGTLGNILGYLNLAELGVGGAISFFLFKPIQSHDCKKINEIISVFGYLYHKIGLIILSAGIIISCFFPFFFAKEEISLGIVYFAFYSFLGSSLIGYFINYRQILLTADQKNYVVAIYFQSAGLVKIALQILLAFYYRNLYVWVAIEFVFGLIGCAVLNWKINKEYPWLKSNIGSGKLLLKKYPGILTNTKQIFIHKIKDFILMHSDEIMVYAFVSLKMVAYYNNYTMIISKLSQLFTNALDSVRAGVGNLVAENNKENIKKVFWELMAIRYFIAGLMCFTIFYFLEPFISLWIGPQYILEKQILILLLINLYIMQSRGVVDIFNHAYGLYADTWSAWTELIINVSITIIVGMKYGIIGILLGKLVSVFIIVVLWKPYYLFSQGFKLPISHYWKGVLRYHIIFILSFTGTYFIVKIFSLSVESSLYKLILYGGLITLIYLTINIPLLFFVGYGTKDFVKRFKTTNKL